MIDYQLEMAWYRLRMYLNPAHNGLADGPVGYDLCSPDDVLDRFLTTYPMDGPCRAKLIDKLTAEPHRLENGKVRVPWGCNLASV
jgi:hypothetical protein